MRGSEVTGKASVGKKKEVNEWIEMVAAYRSGGERPGGGGGGGGGGRVVAGGWGSVCFAVGQPKFHPRFRFVLIFHFLQRKIRTFEKPLLPCLVPSAIFLLAFGFSESQNKNTKKNMRLSAGGDMCGQTDQSHSFRI